MINSSWVALSVAFTFLGFVLLTLGNRKKARAIRLRERTDLKEKRLRKCSREILVERIDAATKSISEKLSAAREVAMKLRERLGENLIAIGKIEAGLTPPTFCHSDSESLKSNIKDIRLKQFDVIKAGKATEAMGSWTWFGSQTKGEQMLTAYRSLLLKAFNAEFDAIRKQMRHATRDTAKKKLKKLEEVLANLGETAGCYISDQYVGHKFRELDIWWNELSLKETKKVERKKQLAILREQAKETSLDTEEMEDEISYKLSDLKEARRIAESLTGLDAKQAAEDIAKLQEDIRVLDEKFQRATSQAQITRAGYIYVISNIGSFGGGIVKIGMTRRLEPMDRVRELGDASVPYRFDVHALIFSEDAPSLEAALQRQFSNKRVNTENLRKEFFRATAEEVSQVLAKMGIHSDWYFEPEAREHYESELIRSARLRAKAKTRKTSESFPEEI